MANTIDTHGDLPTFVDLVERDITEYIDDSLEDLKSYAFYYCSNLSIVDLPYISPVPANAFYSCSTLKSVTFLQAAVIQTSAFCNCTSLTNVVGTNVRTLSSFAFANCNALTSANFPKLSQLGSAAFQSCFSLSKITLPVVSAIFDTAFRNCSSLECFQLPSNYVCRLNASNTFSGTPIASSTFLGYYGSIYVPSSLVSSYKSATNWTYYADRITAYTGE